MRTTRTLRFSGRANRHDIFNAANAMTEMLDQHKGDFVDFDVKFQATYRRRGPYSGDRIDATVKVVE